MRRNLMPRIDQCTNARDLRIGAGDKYKERRTSLRFSQCRKELRLQPLAGAIVIGQDNLAPSRCLKALSK